MHYCLLQRLQRDAHITVLHIAAYTGSGVRETQKAAYYESSLVIIIKTIIRYSTIYYFLYRSSRVNIIIDRSQCRKVAHNKVSICRKLNPIPCSHCSEQQKDEILSLRYQQSFLKVEKIRQETEGKGNANRVEL